MQPLLYIVKVETKLIVLCLAVLAIASCAPSTASRVTDEATKADSATAVQTSKDDPKLFLPRSCRSDEEISAIVKEIDSWKQNKSLISEGEFGFGEGPCAINKYGNSDHVLRMDYSCGDCSMNMCRTSFYFVKDSLVFVRDRVDQYLYPLCASNKELHEEYGIDTLNLDELQKHRETHYNVCNGQNINILDFGDTSVSWGIAGPFSDAQELLDLANDLIEYRESE